jgi:hypothetical protein
VVRAASAGGSVTAGVAVDDPSAAVGSALVGSELVPPEGAVSVGVAPASGAVESLALDEVCALVSTVATSEDWSTVAVPESSALALELKARTPRQRAKRNKTPAPCRRRPVNFWLRSPDTISLPPGANRASLPPLGGADFQ